MAFGLSDLYSLIRSTTSRLRLPNDNTREGLLSRHKVVASIIAMRRCWFWA